mgnify:CR=1 FL=1
MSFLPAVVFASAGDQSGDHSSEGYGLDRSTDENFPHALEWYHDTDQSTLWETLKIRVEDEPFNLIATIIFLLAIIHTFLTARFRHAAHEAEKAHRERLLASYRGKPTDHDGDGRPDEVSFKGQVLHFLGEVEAVFGIWVVVLLCALALDEGWDRALSYVDYRVTYTEPMFVVVIMAMAASRPVLKFARQVMSGIAGIGKRSIAAWWLSILIVGPLLGSFITEPAAMTISALLLAGQFYELKPSSRFAYATIGLLFVNISVGGTFTHFAAPPVLMVAGTWNWDMVFMFTHFGWKALVGIVAAPVHGLDGHGGSSPSVLYWRLFVLLGVCSGYRASPRQTRFEATPFGRVFPRGVGDPRWIAGLVD